MNIKIGRKTIIGVSSLLIVLVMAFSLIAITNPCIYMSPQNQLTDCYFAGNDTDGAALAKYGAKKIPFDSLISIPNGNCIIIDGQTDDLDYQSIKSLIDNHTVFLINVQSTLLIESEIFGKHSYEDFIEDGRDQDQLLRFSLDQSGHPIFTVIICQNPEIDDYRDLVSTIIKYR